MDHITILLNDLRAKEWHITAFSFSFKGRNYIVLFEDIKDLDIVAKPYTVLLTFIDKEDEQRILKTKANDYKFDISAQKLRNYFKIKYAENLGDILRQFYQQFNEFIPCEISNITDNAMRRQVLNSLSRNDNDDVNALICYSAFHNGKINGKQKHRSVFNRDKTKFLYPDLYNAIGKNDDTVSFCYRTDNWVSDAVIIEQFRRNCELR